MKVVTFACEVERLTSQNYELVKENEVLRTQTDKSQREKDLETKLAIVLAENEKLNQVIEELYDMYMADKAGEAPEDYERRIAELLQDLEVWKQRFQNLEGAQGDSDFQNVLRSFEEENKELKEALAERERDLEMLRQRLQVAGTPNEVNVLEEKIIWLVEENTQLKEELRNNKPSLPSGISDDRLLKEYREKINQLIAENESLKEIVTSHMEDQNRERGVHVTEVNKSPLRGGDFEGRSSNAGERVLKSAAPGSDVTSRLQELMRENEDLRKKSGDADKLRDKLDVLLGENERLNAVINKQIAQIEEYRKPGDWVSKMQKVSDENERLTGIISDQLNEIDRLKKQGDGKNTARVDELNNQINRLLNKNNELNNLVIEKDNEVEELKRRLTKDGSAEVIQELKGKLILLTKENEKLNDLLLEKVDEVNKANKVVVGSGVSDDIKNKIILLADENERLNDALREKVKEVDQLKNQQITGDVSSVKWRIDDLTREKERLSAALLDKSKEADEIRRKYYELLSSSSSGSSDLDQLKARIILITEENEKLNNLVLEKSRELEAVRNNPGTNTYNVTTFDTSSYRIKDLEDRLKSSNDENDRLNKQILDRIIELDNLKNRLLTLENSAVVIDDLKSKIVLLMAEIERLNGTITQRNADIDQLTIRLSTDQSETLKYKVKELLGDNERLNNLLNEKFKEIDELRRRLYQVEGSVQATELQIRIDSLTNELGRLRTLLGDKDAELNGLRRRIAELEGGSFALIELQGKLAVVSDENKRLLEELDILRRRLAQDRTAELELKVRDLQNERELLNNLLKTRVDEADAYRRELDSLRNQHVEVVNTLSVDLSKQKEELKSAGVATLKKSSELESKAKQVYDLEERIRTLEADIQRLNDQLYNKETEIARLRQLSSQAETLQYRLDQAAIEKSQLENTLNANYRELDTLRGKAILVERLDSELKGVRENFEAVLKQSDEYRKRIYELESSTGKIRELENALEIVKGENNILRKSLEEKNKTISDLEERARNATLEKERFAFTVEDKSREIDNLKRKHSNELEVAKQSAGETIKLERTRSNNEKDILERRLENLQEENERVKVYLNQTLADHEELKKKYYELEHLRSQEINEFRAQFETLKDINREIKDLQLKSAAERTAYETQLAQYQITLEDIQRQNGLITAENDRLSALNAQRVEELEKIRRLNLEVEESGRLEIIELKSQIEQYKATAHVRDFL